MSEQAPLLYDLDGKRVWVAGHHGMVGAALLRVLARRGIAPLAVSRAALDLRRPDDVAAWMRAQRPQAVFLAAGRVGGIQANLAAPAEFLHDNLAIAASVVDAARRGGVEKLMVLGSACAYPRLATQPIAETALLDGRPEPSNEAFAIAKLATIGLATSYRRQYGCDFISVIPTNLYGPGDNLDPAAGHVIPALIGKIRGRAAGRPVKIWGSGAPLREFLHVDDAADAMVFLMERYSSDEVINIGGGEVVSIRELAALLAGLLGDAGPFHYDTGRADGMPRKQLDAGRLFAMGWRPQIGLRDGLAATCRWVAEATPVLNSQPPARIMQGA